MLGHPFPKMLAIELTNICPMKCSHCPHGHRLINNQGMMKWSTFKQIVDDFCQWKDIPSVLPEVVLYGNGEPLLHKRIVDCVKYCTEHGFRPNLSTNIMFATKELGEKLSAAGLKLIKLSFWGDTKEEYESRTKRQSFDSAIEKANEFISASKETTQIVINIVKYRHLNSSLNPDPIFMERFIRKPNLKFYCFYGSDWRGTIDIDELKTDTSGAPKNRPCNTAGKILAVSWEGKVALCWLDYNREYTLGEIGKKSLLEHWRSSERLAKLKMMYEGRFKELPLCRNCSAPYSEDSKKRTFTENNQANMVTEGRMLYDDDFRNHLKPDPN